MEKRRVGSDSLFTVIDIVWEFIRTANKVLAKRGAALSKHRPV